MADPIAGQASIRKRLSATTVIPITYCRGALARSLHFQRPMWTQTIVQGIKHRPALTLMATVIGLALMGCAAEAPTAHLPGLEQGIGFPDFGVPASSDGWGQYGDSFVPPYGDATTYGDTGAAGTTDGSASGDGGSACASPTSASCSSCSASQTCTGNKAGTCVKTRSLTGAASSKALLLQVALAYVACWKSSQKGDFLCETFNTCAMTGSLTHQMVKDWVCKQAQVVDFPDSTTHGVAKDVCGCSGMIKVYRPDWKLSSLSADKQGIICLSHDAISFKPDRLRVDGCENFPK